MQANAELQAQEEERNQLRLERMHRADRAAAAARAAVKVSRRFPCESFGTLKGSQTTFIRQESAERRSQGYMTGSHMSTKQQPPKWQMVVTKPFISNCVSNWMWGAPVEVIEGSVMRDFS